MKAKIIVTMILISLISLFACSKALSSDNLKDEESINKLLQDFTEAAKEKNADNIIQYFDLQEYVDGYNLEMAKKDFGDNAKRPAYEEKHRRMVNQYVTFLIGFTLTDANKEQNILKDIDIKLQQLNLEDLTIERIDVPNEQQTRTDSFKNILKTRCKKYGAESITFRTVLYRCGTQTYYCGFELRKYNGTWKIDELRASLTNVDVNIVIQPVSEKEYLKIIGK
ncbi:MAG TPA: hypothetical protein PLA54_06660 [Spirochaetota bacterium]|nr:hypothetical protein [Spirochaetota bacterium]HQE58862.1 hypothetical protein [Spirochaetota bacterium]